MKEGSNIQMRVVSRMEEVDQSSWEEIRDRNNLLTDLSYLKAVEESDVNECEYQYFEFYKSGQLICSMFGYVIINDAVLFSGEFIKKFISAIRRILPGLLKIKTLEIGSPVGLGLTISISPHIKREYLSSIVNLLKKYARQNRIKVILVRDFKEGKAPIESILSKAGFKCVPNLPDSIMKIEWGSFEEYLSCLKKNYRRQARKKIRKKDDQGIRTLISNEIGDLNRAKGYAELVKNVTERAVEYARESIGEQYHVAMFNNLKGSSYWLQYYDDDDELVAFVHFIVYKGTMMLQYVGMDYEISRDALLYFNSYYDQIKFAIENGIKSIEAGITTYRTKSELGFSLYPQRMYVWHKNPLLRPFIGMVFKANENKMEEYHYAFKNNTNQYLWDGKDMFAFCDVNNTYLNR